MAAATSPSPRTSGGSGQSRVRKVVHFYILSNLEILFCEICDYIERAFLVCESKSMTKVVGENRPDQTAVPTHLVDNW